MTYDLKYIFLLLGTALLLSCCSKTHTPEEIDKLFEPITTKYGIKIVYQLDETFDPILIGGGRADFSKVEPIESQVLARYPMLLTRALERYPVPVIKTYLSAVYFAKELDSRGLKYGGTYDPFRKIIYLVDNGDKPDDLAIGTFHHEFSSILLKRNGFYHDPWLNQNPNDFQYLQKSGRMNNATYDGSLSGTPANYQDGFMNGYSHANFENDFSEYARFIFTHPKKFKTIMDQHPRVRGKYLIWQNFYNKIDPIFTESYLLGNG